MDFAFIGGSMGSVVGEKTARAIDYSIKTHSFNDFQIRAMMEASALPPHQKISAKLAQPADANIPYISVQTQQQVGQPPLSPC